MKRPRHILLIRRDNIGDLVCTTPLFAALRARYPDAYIALLANTYCAPVVAHSPHLDRVFIYAKAKHLPRAERPAAYWARIRLIQELRRVRFDDVILAAASYYARGLEFARWLRKSRVIGFASEQGKIRGLDVALPRDAAPRHEVEDLFQLLAPLDVEGMPPAATLVPDPISVARVAALLRTAFGEAQPIAVHISARLPSNRWHLKGYVGLIRALILEGHKILLLWSPGEANDPAHPGDDALAGEIEKSVASPALLALPTQELPTLIAALDVCRGAILSDGGAMHIAAALKKPLVCFFGHSDAIRWHPWRCPHILLQPSSRNVADVTIEQALNAARRLFTS
jgi:ADP-heptose:LPS heptosyltransferase